jgi:ribosome biogenesis SPOUT family RNA methylase Rps3
MKTEKAKQKPIYIIEHLEPKLWDWCFIEYENISKLVGKDNLWFTNIKNKVDSEKLKNLGRVFSQSIREIKLKGACVLDPESSELLKPDDNFNYYVFGGILGDYPPRKRTGPELTKFLGWAETRNIGKEQMSTDNAVFTVKKITEGVNFANLKFLDKVSVKLGKFEFVDLPYRYNLVNGKPFMSKKIIDYMKKKGVFR